METGGRISTASALPVGMRTAQQRPLPSFHEYPGISPGTVWRICQRAALGAYAHLSTSWVIWGGDMGVIWG
jgi:hypothetical protein